MRCGANSGLNSAGVIANKTRMLLDLVRFEHSVFALPYAYIGALYGAATISRWPSLGEVIWITIAMIGARAFAFAVNRAVDKEIDSRNPRTASRAVPAGLIKAGELWTFAAIMLVAFLAAVWQLHPLTRWLWPIVLAAFVIYPYTKRFTWLCHYWLGMCLGLAPVGAWVALTGSLTHPSPWAFGVAVLLWTAGFDIIYATMDYECDVRDGIHSVPADFGIGRALMMTRVLHAAAVAFFIAAGLFVPTGFPFYLGIVVAAVLLAYENAIVSPTDLTRVDAAFFTFNGIIAIVILAGVLADRLIGA